MKNVWRGQQILTPMNLPETFSFNVGSAAATVAVAAEHDVSKLLANERGRPPLVPLPVHNGARTDAAGAADKLICSRERPPDPVVQVGIGIGQAARRNRRRTASSGFKVAIHDEVWAVDGREGIEATLQSVNAIRSAPQ